MEEKKVLSKADLLSGVLLKRELVFVKDWGASVWLRELSSEHMLEFRKRTKELQDIGVKNTTPEQDFELLTFVLSCSLCDENGSLLFTQDEAKKLVVNNLGTLNEVAAKVFEVSKIKQGNNGQMTSEVTDDLPNDQMKSSSESSPLNSDEQEQKS